MAPSSASLHLPILHWRMTPTSSGADDIPLKSWVQWGGIMTGAGAVMNSQARPGASIAVFGVGNVDERNPRRGCMRLYHHHSHRCSSRSSEGSRKWAQPIRSMPGDRPVEAVLDITGGGANSAWSVSAIPRCSGKPWMSYLAWGSVGLQGLFHRALRSA
jgi:hypothetical protein